MSLTRIPLQTHRLQEPCTLDQPAAVTFNRFECKVVEDQDSPAEFCGDKGHVEATCHKRRFTVLGDLRNWPTSFDNIQRYSWLHTKLLSRSTRCSQTRNKIRCTWLIIQTIRSQSGQRQPVSSSYVVRKQCHRRDN